MQSIALNHLAILAATIMAFVLGGLWYGPLFGKTWIRETGLSDAAVRANVGKVYGLAFLWTLVMAYNLAFFIGNPAIGVAMATFYGFAAGAGWIAMGLFVVGLFERRSLRLMLINGGYMAVALPLMGAIIGAWR